MGGSLSTLLQTSHMLCRKKRRPMLQRVKNPQNHFLTLDCARGVAALAVVAYHIHWYDGIDYASTGGSRYFSHAFLAVDLFFLMSGFVIARSYEARLRAGAMGIGRFVRARIIRLYPLYLLGMAGGVIFWATSPAAPQVGSLWTSLALGAAFLPQLHDFGSDAWFYPFNGVAWSLGFELAINLVFAALLAHLPTRHLSVLCAVAAGIFLASAIIHGSFDIGYRPSQLGEGLARVCASFIAGQILLRCQVAGCLPSISISAGAQVLVLGLLLVAMPANTLGLGYDVMMLAIVFPVFVTAACQAVPAPRLQPWFAQMGRLSYAIYILHRPLCYWCASFWLMVSGRPIADFPVAGGLALSGTVLAVAFVATAVFDEPLRRALTAFFNSTGTQRHQSPAADVSHPATPGHTP